MHKFILDNKVKEIFFSLTQYFIIGITTHGIEIWDLEVKKRVYKNSRPISSWSWDTPNDNVLLLSYEDDPQERLSMKEFKTEMWCPSCLQIKPFIAKEDERQGPHDVESRVCDGCKELDGLDGLDILDNLNLDNLNLSNLNNDNDNNDDDDDDESLGGSLDLNGKNLDNF